MFHKEIRLSFVRECPLAAAWPVRCSVSEGISLPFRAQVTLFLDNPLTQKELEDCLLLKTRLEMSQQDTTGAMRRGRTFHGIITSYNALGLLSDINDTAPGNDCYGYEIVIEPEIALMGLNLRTRSFPPDNSPADIISSIFAEYNLPCSFDVDLFDKLPSQGQAAQENNETDLNFINRFSFYYGLNYVLELPEDTEEGDPSFAPATAVFSRGWRTGRGRRFTGNTLTEAEEISCIIGSKEAASFAQGPLELDRLVKTGFAGIGSIRGSSVIPGAARTAPPVFLKGFETVRGAGKKPGEEILAFGRESAQALDRLFSDRTLIKAHDFAVASGQPLLVNKSRYLTVRSRFSFNLALPKGFRRASGCPAAEEELSLTAVAVPFPDDAADNVTLGPLCCFSRIPDNPNPGNAFVISEIPRPGQSFNLTGAPALRSDAAGASGGNSDTEVCEATVCDSAGKTGSPGTVAPAADDDTAFPARFYARIDGSDTAITANFVSFGGSQDPLGNFPKIGQKILLLHAGNSYYFMGYLSKQDALPVYDSGLRNDLMMSEVFNSGYDPSGTAGADRKVTNTNRDQNNQCLAFVRFSKSAALVKYLIMQDHLADFMKCLALRSNTRKITEIYDSKKKEIQTQLTALENARDKLDEALNNGTDLKTAKDNLTKAEADLTASAETIVSKIKDVRSIKKRLAEILKEQYPDTEPSKYTAAQKDAALEIILGLAGFSLFYDGTHREYGAALENAAATDITASAGKKVSIQAGSDIVITADSSITLQVGNSALSMDGNGISLSTAYFKNKFSPWDGRITLSPVTGVSVSGYQFQANALMAAGMSDSFGGSVGTKTGLMSVSAPQIKLNTMNGMSAAKVITALSLRVADAISDTACQSADNDDGDMAASIISNLCDYGNTGLSIADDAITALKEFIKAVNSGTCGPRSVADLVISFISVILDTTDVLEALVACDIVRNASEDYDFVKRTPENGYVSEHDKYLIIISSIRTAALMTSGLLLMADNLASSQISVLELNASGATHTAGRMEFSTVSGSIEVSPLAAQDTAEVGDSLIDGFGDADALALTADVAAATARGLRNIAGNTGARLAETATMTNLGRHDVTGSEEISVTQSRTALHEDRTAGTRTDGTGSRDDISGSSGKINATETGGAGSSENSDALKSGTTGVKDIAGGLKTNQTLEDIS
ncbi:contractile injection system protein, VgrG/Pvc8 family [Succinimonas sp.]|uniref:contractile injection system protein, VgrG/Pvc8 family n=1 Tax=Succinimonas sp. TaxID=1936151 RepID=UPI00386F7618